MERIEKSLKGAKIDEIINFVTNSELYDPDDFAVELSRATIDYAVLLANKNAIQGIDLTADEAESLAFLQCLVENVNALRK